MFKNIIKMLLIYILPILSFLLLFNIYNNKYCSIISLLSIIGLKYIYDSSKKLKYEKREIIIIIIISFIIGCFITFGTLIDRNFDNYSYSFLGNWKLIIISLYSTTVLLFNVIKILYNLIENIKNDNKCFNRHFHLISFICMVICWIPYLYNYFPALMSPDSLNQYGQAVGSIELSNHHPIVHTMLIKIFYLIGKLFKSVNIGVMFYSLFQIILLASIFSYILSYFYKKGINKNIIILLLSFYCFLPIFGYYTVTIWKDVIFGAVSALLIFQLYKLAFDDENKISDNILLFVSAFLTCTFRTNGLLAVLVLAVILYIIFKQKRKYIGLLLGIPVVLTFILNGPVYNHFGISKTEFTENAGIMLRQIYGTIYDGGYVDKKSEEYLAGLVNLEEALEIYTPYDDHIKMLDSYSNEYMEKTKKEFILTYLRIGIHNIRSYIRIYLKSTYGVWYPEAQGYIVHNWVIADNVYGIKSKNHFDNLKIGGKFFKLYNMPIVKLFMSEALYIWIYLILLGFMIIKKHYKSLLVVLLPFFVFGTIMIATPLSYQPRYMFIMHCSCPVILLIVLMTVLYRKKDQENEKQKKKKR